MRTTPRWACLCVVVSFLCSAASAFGDVTLAGYKSRVTGEVLKYHSPDPEVNHGLLVRSLESSRCIEWETEAVPPDFTGEFASFVWMFGLDVEPAAHRFTVSVNGEAWFEFRNPATSDVRDWTLAGPGGATLRFRATMIDRFGDLMGYAIMRVPRSALTPGRALRLGVSGESAGSWTWYFTFQSAVTERAEISSSPAVVRDPRGNYQPLTLSVTHVGAPADAVISTTFGVEEHRTLELGGNRFEIRHPEVREPVEIGVRVMIGGREAYVLSSRVEPVRHWSINLVQHSHTDVGYTRPQTEILAEQVRFIDTALDCCDETETYPPDAQFRWTCEVSWPVREYLRTRTAAQIDRLRRRVKEGRIEVTGMFLNMSEVMDEGGYSSFLEPVREFREQGLAVTTAMQNDVNGVAWCLADYFSKVGIEYLIMGEHGHRALIPFERPTVFWWESPAGGRVLAFRADHYMTGNFWGVHTGRVEAVEDELLRYLSRLERSGYVLDRIGVQHSGYPTDNSPPSIASSDLVRRWNERFEWPRLRCAVAREFPESVKKDGGEGVPTIRQAWPDWWTDGFGSAARESAAARVTQSRVTASEGLLAMQSAAGLERATWAESDVGSVREALNFWGEHTMGSAESIREPLCENSQVQWAEKAAYAWDAVKREGALDEAAMGRMGALVGSADGPRLLVVNTLNYVRSGVLELYADHAVLPLDRAFRLVDDRGAVLAVQLLRSRAEGSYWAVWARDIPAFGWREFRVEVDAESAAMNIPATRSAREVESVHYRLKVDAARGGISELIDKASGANLVDAGAEWLLGQVVHEALGNREQIEAFMLEKYARRSLERVVVEGVVDGPIWSSVSWHGELAGCRGPGGVRCEARVFHTDKRVEFRYTMQKERVFDPEAIYVAFPFAAADGKVAFETLGGVADPSVDLIPGTASDWQAAQGFASVRWAGGQIVVSSPEIPLYQFGGMNIGKFQRRARVERPHMFSWVMNNYWTTNFCAGQEGEFRWSYALTSACEGGPGEATRFGWGVRIPLLGRISCGRGAARALENRSVLAMDAPNLILVAARPAVRGPGLILHMREVEGSPARLATSNWRIGGRRVRVHEVSVLGEEIGAIDGEVEFGAREVKFLRLEAE
ncbi:MAG: glycosyl hydrolase family 38 [Phycisphaerales bacterium]|nr:glycosyl hydrolase family 38 [Phycisphaerales bacterium]